VKQFKQLTLIFASFLVVAFSFSSAKSFDSSASLQKKSVISHFNVLADDDIDDDLTDHDFQFTYTSDLDFFPAEQNLIESPQSVSGFLHSSTPFYLKIRSLRI
jgi:hypothetical protein